MLADLQQRVVSGELAREEVAQAMTALLDPTVDDESKGAFLRVWARRGETAFELAACAEVLLPRAIDPGVRGSWHGKPLLDCCGTGGGGLNLLNISTGIVFILAAMGIPVVKHGNRGLTKKSGSADVLEALGIRINLPPEKLESCLEEVGAAFLFAPAYHTSFSVLAPIRRQLGAEGQRTVFNLLGPLLNPARPDARLVGVFTEEHQLLYDDALSLLSCPKYAVVWGRYLPGGQALGEASAHGQTKICGTLRVGDRPFTKLPWRSQKEGNPDLDSILVSSADESARLLLAVLDGKERGFAREMLLVNAMLAALTQRGDDSLDDSWSDCQDALDSGRAANVLRKWQQFSESA